MKLDRLRDALAQMTKAAGRRPRSEGAPPNETLVMASEIVLAIEDLDRRIERLEEPQPGRFARKKDGK